MPIIYAIILGLVQGLTEFIPVSSSGHLVIVGHFLNIGNAFIFDTLLNIGSLLALVFFYRHRIWSIIVRIFGKKEWNLLAKTVIALVPAVTVGLVFRSQVEQLNGMIWVVVVMLVAVGIPMIIFGKEKDGADNRKIEDSVGWKLSLKTGIAQALALVPGVSRSGITILTGLRSNLSAERAAEFSFLLAVPIIAGASFKLLISSEGIDFIKNNLAAFTVGNIASFLSGIIAINFFVKLISKRGLKDFGWYRIALAVFLTLWLVLGLI